MWGWILCPVKELLLVWLPKKEIGKAFQVGHSSLTHSQLSAIIIIHFYICFPSSSISSSSSSSSSSTKCWKADSRKNTSPYASFFLLFLSSSFSSFSSSSSSSSSSFTQGKQTISVSVAEILYFKLHKNPPCSCSYISPCKPYQWYIDKPKLIWLLECHTYVGSSINFFPNVHEKNPYKFSCATNRRIKTSDLLVHAFACLPLVCTK